MRALIVRQPYAGLFAAGLKVNATGEIIDFRNRPTRIREDLAIQAVPARLRPPCQQCMKWTRRESYYRGRILVIPPSFCGPDHPNCRYMPRELLVVATLADCRPVELRDAGVPGYDEWMVQTNPPPAFAWVFTDLYALEEPIPCKPPRGARVWFHLPEEVEQVLRERGELA